MSNGNRGAVERVFREAEFVRSLGIELAAHGAGWCETRVKILPALRQQHGFAHAGVLVTLADHTSGGAAASTVAEDRDVITVENTISFLRPAASAELFCPRHGVARGQEPGIRRSGSDGRRRRGARAGGQDVQHLGGDCVEGEAGGKTAQFKLAVRFQPA